MDTTPPERGKNIAQTAAWRRKFPRVAVAALAACFPAF
jgi:hypothetical protein